MLQQSMQEMIQHPPIKQTNGDWFFYDPLDNKYYLVSGYLYQIFKDHLDSLWIANMVTHYRHNHIKYWNRCWGGNGKRYRKDWFSSYDDEKKKVNERAKRQIVRKCWPYMKWHGITAQSFDRLEQTEEKTWIVVEKYLSSPQQQLR